MNRFALPLVIAVATVGLSTADFAHNYPRLPDRIASHFDAAGRADGWMAKGQFTAAWFGGVAILVFTFTMACVVAWVSPVAGFNLPRKAYWLAPHRQETARRMIVERMLWFVAAILLFMAYLLHGVLEVNLKGGQITVWKPLAIFLIFTLLWTGEMIWRFQRTPAEPSGIQE